MRVLLLLLVFACPFCWAQLSLSQVTNNPLLDQLTNTLLAPSFNPYDSLDEPTPEQAPVTQGDDTNDVIVLGTFYGSNVLFDDSGYSETYNLLSSIYEDEVSNIIDLLAQQMLGMFGGSFTAGSTFVDSSFDFENSYFTDAPFTDTAFVIDIDTSAIIASFNVGASDSFDLINSLPASGDTIEIDGEEYNIVNQAPYSPIILDLNNNGKADVSRHEWKPHTPNFFKERTAVFDITGDGRLNFIEWLAPEDGLLVMPESDGSVKDGNNLFGTAGGYNNGYEKMTLVLDADRNGWVEGDELAGLYIWRDMNGNAKADSGEMKPISHYKVEKISTRHQEFESTCVIDGQERKTWDWWPTGFEMVKKAK